MSRTQRKHRPPNAGGLKSRLDKAKKENAKLRTLTNRQRRNLKNLTAVILNTRKALGDNDILRATALVSGNVKYPPSAASGVDTCPQHGENSRWTNVCDTCGEEL